MATVAFAAAASSSGYVGAQYAMAVTIGSIIDQAFLMPALFPADPIEGARLGEVQIMGADEGGGVSMAFGTKARVAGQVIWAGTLEEIPHSVQVGKAGKQTSFSYYLDCAVAISYVGSDAANGTLDRINAVFADEKRIYDGVSGGQLFLQKSHGGVGALELNGSHYIYFDDSIDANVITDMHDVFNVGDSSLAITGFTLWPSVNNTTSDTILQKTTVVVGTGKGQQTLPAWRMSEPKLNEIPTSSLITVTRNDSRWADGVQFNGTEPTFHMGDQTAADTHMVARLGANVSAMKDMAYMVADSLALAEYGNTRIPNFEFVISSASALQGVSGVFAEILAQSALQTADYDVSGIGSENVIGYAVKSPIPTAQALQPLMLAFDIIAQERGRKIYFFDRADQISQTIGLDANFIGATIGSDIDGGRVDVQQVPITQRLGEVTVAFVDANDEDFKASMARAFSMSESSIGSRDTPSRWNKMAVNLPITMTEDKAREIAYRLLFATHSDNLRFKFTLPPRYFALQENDRVSFIAGGVSYNALIQKIDVGWHNILEVDAALDVAVEQDFSIFTA